MEAIAKHDFKATAPDELSFKKGSLLRVSVCEHISRRRGPASEGWSWRCLTEFNAIFTGD